MTQPLPRSRSIIAATVMVVVTVVGTTFVTSSSPLQTLSTFAITPWSNRYALGNLLSNATLLTLTGLGVTVAFRAGSFNLGGEGQLYLSAVVTAALTVALPDLPWVGAITGVIAAGTIAGFSGWLRHTTDADELITTFLIASAVTPVLDYLLVGPLRDPTSNLLASAQISSHARLTSLLSPSTFNTGVVWALLAVGITHIAIHHTLFGYELRIVGHNRRVARYAGIPLQRYTVVPLALSGVLHGLGGVVLVLGVHHRAILGFAGGLGWNGIAVALIARSNPLFVLPSALLFATLQAGSRAVVLENQSTWELGSIIQAVVFLFVTATVALPSRLRRRPRVVSNGEKR